MSSCVVCMPLTGSMWGNWICIWIPTRQRVGNTRQPRPAACIRTVIPRQALEVAARVAWMARTTMPATAEQEGRRQADLHTAPWCTPGRRSHRASACSTGQLAVRRMNLDQSWTHHAACQWRRWRMASAALGARRAPPRAADQQGKSISHVPVSHATPHRAVK